MDYRCRLGTLGNLSTASGGSDFEGTVGPNNGKTVWTCIFSALLFIFTLPFLHSFSVSSSYFIATDRIHMSSEEHSCMSY